ncbi:pilus assembly PilX family protein [Sulfurivermis fontis]|uniref:pilus assembly PilX family protein n=1 Tax=Sulfurivermis fontis TaxID=1972068 RepID=UPI001E5AAD2A|nr:PilX N-terminal domain-containing pilus assembly protein [Sulfurivermis fontis]
MERFSKMNIRPRRPIHPALSQQQGATLIVALIILLLMTIIGTVAMQGTTLEERMAGNTRDMNLAFQASEAALRAGEGWLQNPANLATAETNQPMRCPDNCPDPENWDGVTPAPTGSVAGIDNVAANPVYHVGPPLLIRINPGALPPKFRKRYEVTAYGMGGSATTVTIVQSSTIDP